jgi:hypothetical protein
LIGLASAPTGLSGSRPSPFRQHRDNRQHSSAECEIAICWINELTVITDDVVEAARGTLVIGVT